IIDLRSFMIVTGPKADTWLVKTVGALLIPVGVTMLSYLSRPIDRPLFILATGTAVSFAVIDLYYSLNDVISDVYMADAAIELIFLVGWIVYWWKLKI